jgi:hypothetical protein
LKDDRLLAEPPNHVERTLGLTAQRQFLHVFGNAALHYGPQFLRNREEPICRIQPVQRLVRSFVVVVLHPQPNPLPCLLETLELCPTEELFPDRLPEPFDFAQGHRVMGLTLEVMDVIFLKFLLEARFAAPTRILPAIVGEHLLGYAVLADRRAIDLQHILRALAAEQIQPDDVARVVIEKRDQVGVLAAQPKREDVRLPHLVGCTALKEPRFGRILRHLLLRFGHQSVLVQRAPHRLVAARQKQCPPQQLCNPLHTELGVLLLQRGDLRLDCGCHLGYAGFAPANQWL